MLFTLCYVYLWLRYRTCYALLIRNCVRKLHRTSSFTFCTQVPQHHAIKSSSGPPTSGEDKFCLKVGSKVFLVEGSQLFEDLSKWKFLLGSSADSDLGVGSIAFITESVSLPSKTLFLASDPYKKICKLSEYCLPIALCHDDSSKLLAEASIDNFTELGIAFMEDRLQMDNGSLLQKITSVYLKGISVSEKEQETKKVSLNLPTSRTTLTSNLTTSQEKTQPEMGMSESTEMAARELSNSSPSLNEQTDQMKKEQATGEHRHLHLSSCHECLELENRTIESVRFASAENIPDLPDEYLSTEDNSDQNWLKENTSLNVSGKPPNVLIYGGSKHGEAFQRVKELLLNCFDSSRYVVYPISDDQIQQAPWMDNCLLLVVVEGDTLSADIHGHFMKYLSKGGKILGLSSSFTFGSLTVKHKSELQRSIQVLIFNRPNCDQFSFDVMVNGKVFEEPVGGNHDRVETWGYLNNGSKDVMMIHQTYGDCGGEAILCQIELDLTPELLTGHDKEVFDSLKLSNPRRHEVLTQLLTSLGLECELSSPPSLTPVYLLTAEPGLHPAALQWIQSRTDKEGQIKSSKMLLKVCSSLLGGMEISPSLAPLVTETEDVSFEDFSLETYRENIRTEKLGKILLFAEVTTSTFNLLDGLMFHEPKEMGLIAIAGQQTQGKGRGGNVWLSPKGCAMITVHISVPLSSSLGQRIAFVQHLMALAVVESVTSIPGYEDIELKVKWPNDIYYKDLMKLGGVLVNSTLMGDMFHILIGCGFNVSNSNPTICINDLIMDHNRRNNTNLKPLRVDYLIARAVTTLENLINAFQKDGPNGILPVYYKHWVHSGCQVRLGSEDGPLAWIVGLDDSGFLQVLQEGKDIVSVHPDGNSFDMLRNLIVPKRS
ncbi:biotin-- ligase isoform X1 [Pelobates cultripes]|uniref:Biotin-- ligase isoform X1 n=2 Tax=Pelobates cultripes TaxID=61616 RepID=A0AAD1QX01_PELCU|nr:biotin-- ligase isoform X1 [Pelobates cultripes]